MACCGAHCHSPHQHCWGWAEPAIPFGYSPPRREDYIRTLEDERDLLERRLRRLERELEELRGGARSTEGQS